MNTDVLSGVVVYLLGEKGCNYWGTYYAEGAWIPTDKCDCICEDGRTFVRSMPERSGYQRRTRSSGYQRRR